MITNKKLFMGWKSKKTVLTARVLRAASNVVASNWKIATRHQCQLEKLDAPVLV